MKKITPFLLVSALFLIVSSPTYAYYQVLISKNNVSIYQGSVLGDEDSIEAEKENESENKQENKEEIKQEVKQEAKQENKDTEKEKKELQEKRQELQKESIKKQQEIKKEAVKEAVKLQKKIETNTQKTKAIINPEGSTLTVEQLSLKDAEKLKSLMKERLELQKELADKNKEYTQKEKDLLKEKINKTKEEESKIKVKTVNKIEDDQLELSSESQMRFELKDDNGKHVDIQEKEAKIKTSLPVGTDTENSLVIKTPDENFETEHTPNKILEDLRSKKIIDMMSSSDEGSPESSLVLDNGKPVYEIKGNKSINLFGFIPLSIEKDVQVSAETGSVITTKQTMFARILESLSF